MDRNARTAARGAYRVLPQVRVGLGPVLGLVGLVVAATPLFSHLGSLAPVADTARETSVLPSPAPGDALRLVVHIQDAGFFIEGADEVLAPANRRVWCEADRCDRADLRELTRRLAAIKDVHPTTNEVVFVAGMTVPFGRVQAAMDAARSDPWDTGTPDETRWLFPHVTVQPDQMGEDRFLRLRLAGSSVRI